MTSARSLFFFLPDYINWKTSWIEIINFKQIQRNCQNSLKVKPFTLNMTWLDSQKRKKEKTWLVYNPQLTFKSMNFMGSRVLLNLYQLIFNTLKRNKNRLQNQKRNENTTTYIMHTINYFTIYYYHQLFLFQKGKPHLKHFFILTKTSKEEEERK